MIIPTSPRTTDRHEAFDSVSSSRDEVLEWLSAHQSTVEHVLLPAFRSSLIVQRERVQEGCIVPLADLPELYKVFERC
jgi:hypothetical protein